MKIIITGINGYLGQLITKQLVTKKHEVSGVKRELLYSSNSDLQNTISSSDIIINLAGAPILKRWTKKNKQIIYNSRINTTKTLVEAINKLPPNKRPKKFLAASAIGIYANGISHNETSANYSNKFVGQVVKDWENQLLALPSSIQCNILRIGLVLGKEAKTIKNLKTPFELGLGGKIGSGKQAFPFIHETDLVNAFVYAVENSLKSPIYNLVAPQRISNLDFTVALAEKLNRPALFTIPTFVVKMILGEASSLLLESPEVEPKALLNDRFQFEYATIEAALSEILA